MAGDKPGPRCNHEIQSRAGGNGDTVRVGGRYTCTVAQDRFGCPDLGVYVRPVAVDRGKERSWGDWAGPQRPSCTLVESVMAFCRVAQYHSGNE